MFVVDASVWVSRFVAGDAFYQASRAWLGAQVDRGEVLVAPGLLLPELGGAVARRTGLSDLGIQSVSQVQRLPNTRLVAVDAELSQLSAGLAADFRMRGADAIYVALAQLLGVPLVTWDHEQSDRGRTAVRVMTPEEALRLL